MKQSVQVPPVGESVTSGILAAWLKQDGEYVREGDELFEFETDKATLPVPSPASGVITIKVKSDEEVEIGTVVAEIDTEASAPADESRAAGDSGGAGAAKSDDAGAAAVGGEAAVGSGAAARGGSAEAETAAHDALSPAVKRALEEYGLSAAEVSAAVKPTGKDGRLTKGDVEQYARSGAAEGSKTAGGTGPATRDSGTPAGTTRGAPTSAGRQERTKMSNLRRRIAENLVKSKQESAHLTTFNEVDMSEVMAIRARHKDSFEKAYGVRLGFMSFFIKAAQQALVAYPAVNAFVDGTEIIYNYFYNVGVAISTEAGLIVPVIRNVNERSFAEIEAAIVDFAQRAKEKRIMPDEFSGGTFTITNGGVFGSMLSTPIPSPPQTGVLGMHSITKRAVVIDDEIVIRPMMYLALTYDHRIIDGREAIGFLTHIKRQIEDPSALLLEL